jgi:glycine/D-amino acid oxidase-like deaminating enzyme
LRQQIDILIIGQGICGTFLSLELERAGVSHLVLDDKRPLSASRAAAGLINPVTGRRIVTTWMIDELLAFAREAYGRLPDLLGSSFFETATVVDFFPTPQMRLAFLRRQEEDGAYLRMPANEHQWDGVFRSDFGYGMIGPCYLVDLPGLLEAARRRMLEKGFLREERFGREELVVVSGDMVLYKDIEARKIVFCDGIEGASDPWFSRLPFAPNKGEALVVAIEGLAEHIAAVDPAGTSNAASGQPGPAQRTIFKRGISLVPWPDETWWVGSSYEWAFGHGEPTDAFRHRTETLLREWLKLPVRTLQHLSSVRPATLERRPFVGFHPTHPAIGILNGMGTKGCSLAPYFAHQLAQHISNGAPILPEADVRRFTKVLGRH